MEHITQKNEEDPLTMYLVVRESLNMSLGKTCVQVGHATQRLQRRYSELCNKAEAYIDPISGSGIEHVPHDLLDSIRIFDDWLKVGVQNIT